MFRGYNAVYFGDELKMVCGVDTGVFSNTHSVAESHGLPRFADVFESGGTGDNGNMLMNDTIRAPSVTKSFIVISGASSRLVAQHTQNHSALGFLS